MDIAHLILKALLVGILGSGTLIFGGLSGIASTEKEAGLCRAFFVAGYADVIGAAIVAVLPL